MAPGGAEGAGLRGIPVDQIVVDPQLPAVSHGRFAVTNPGSRDRTVRIDTVRIVMVRAGGGSSVTSVPEFFVYRLPSYDEVDPAGIAVAAGGEMEFEVSFAAVPLAEGLTSDAPVTVELGLVVDGQAERVSSPWAYTIRTPRR